MGDGTDRDRHVVATVTSIGTVHAKAVAEDDGSEAVRALGLLLDLIRAYPDIGEICRRQRDSAAERDE
jgi:hypothetical protein